MPKQTQIQEPTEWEDVAGIGPKRAERLRQDVGEFDEFKANSKNFKKNRISSAVSGNRRNLPQFAQNAIEASSQRSRSPDVVDNDLVQERQVDKRTARTRSKTTMQQRNEDADRSDLGFETMERHPSELDRAAERFTSAYDGPFDPSPRELGEAAKEQQDPNDRATVQPLIGAATSRTVFGSREPGEAFKQELETVTEQTDRATASPGELADGFINFVEQNVGLSKRSPDSGFFTTSPTQPTDIGREADGEFARPERDPDIRPAPIDRDTKTGRFGLDPFDLSAGALASTNESREIEFGGEQIDLTQQDTDDLEQMNDFLTRNLEAEIDAERAKGGFGTSDMAQDFSARQVEVQTELDRRGQ